MGSWDGLHGMTVASFAITLHDQCCRLHVEGRVVSDISVVRSCCHCWSICSLCSESTLWTEKIHQNAFLSYLLQNPTDSALLSNFGLIWFTILSIERFSYFGILAWNCLFTPILGGFGSIFPPNDVVYRCNPQKAPPYAETRRLAIKR